MKEFDELFEAARTYKKASGSYLELSETLSYYHSKANTDTILKLEKCLKSLQAQRDVLREGLKRVEEIDASLSELPRHRHVSFRAGIAREALLRCDELENEK